MPLSEALGYTPEFAINEYAVYLRDLDVYYMPGFKLLPESTLLCIRYPVTLTSGKTEVETREKCNISVFRDMFSYVYADKPEKPAEVLPVKTTLDEFKVMLGEYAQEKKVEISDEIIAGTADVAPEGFFEETGADLYKANGVTYLVYCGKIYVLGKHVGGAGLLDIEVFNFDNNDKNDIIFSYSYKNGDEVVSSLSVFNFTTMKETFLSVSAPMPLTLEKGENGKVEVYKASEETEGLSSSLLVSKNKGEHICTVFGDGKDVLIKAVG